MDGWMNGWIDGMDGRMYDGLMGWMDAGMHGQRDWTGVLDGSMENGQMNGWMDGG